MMSNGSIIRKLESIKESAEWALQRWSIDEMKEVADQITKAKAAFEEACTIIEAMRREECESRRSRLPGREV